MYNKWKTIKLKDICDYKTGKLNSNAAKESGKYPFFTCSPQPLKTNTYSFEQDAILLAGNNANGKFHLNYYNGKFDAYQRTYVMKTKNEQIVDNIYLYYYIALKLNYLKEISVGSATKFLTKTILDNIKIDYPEYDEMKFIGKTLRDIDKKIETNNEINKKLEEMAQAIFKQWFVDFEFPNEDGEPYKSSGGEMVESELGVIPKGWEESNVLDNIEQVKNKNKEKLDLPVLTVVKDGKFICSEEYFTKQVYSKDTSNYKIVEKYDVGYNPSRANIGSIAMLKEFDKGLLSPMYVVFRLNKKIMPFYFEYYMKRPGFIEKIALNSSGTTRQNFDYKAFRDFKIIIPSIEVQEKAFKIINNLQENIKNRNLENNNLMKIRDTLLPKLMCGEIRVPLNNE